MARSSTGRPGSNEPEESAESAPERTEKIDKFWSKVRIEPIEVNLPSGVGYTLRAYRLDTEVTPTDYAIRHAEEAEAEPARSRYVSLDEDVESAFEDFDEEFEDEDGEDEDAADDESSDDDDESSEEDESDGDDDSDEDNESDEDDDSDEEDDADEIAERDPEEVPVFLSHNGHLLLFRSPEGLVDFIGSQAEHDLSQLDGWSSFAADVRPEYIVATHEDTYELDLIVANLRGGHDSWEPDLILKCGQFGRDLGHALRLDKVVLALAPGSPLDDLDEALRDSSSGGFGTFFARRRVRKIGTETASLSWRTIVGKISAVVDWRD